MLKWKIKALNKIKGWAEFVNEENSAISNKKTLLEMARNGEPKPVIGRHPLGHLLCNYTREKSNSYDSKFKKEIRELVPQWYIDTASENKKKLLEMARNGEPRPNKKDPLHGFLTNYTREKSNSYDSKFKKEIRELVPQWFVSTSSKTKKKLLEMANNGEPRPHREKHPLGVAFNNYINPNNVCYDIEFDKKIRELAPQWFINITAENKKRLLEMAKNGESRPSCSKHPLGKPLTYYTGIKGNSYDPEFDKEIRELRPDWFTKG